MSRVEDALKAANETCALRIGREVLNEVAVMFKEQFPGKRAVVVADETTWDVAGKKSGRRIEKGRGEVATGIHFYTAGPVC